MSDESKKQNEGIINEFIKRVIDKDLCLKDYCNNEKNNKEVSNILKSMLLSKTKNDLKVHCKELMEKLKEFGMTVYPNSENDIPLLWTNGRPVNVFKDELYNSETGHYQDEDSPIFNVLWNIMPVILYPEKHTESFLENEYKDLIEFNNAEKEFISAKNDFEKEKSRFKSKKKKTNTDIENFKNKEILFKNEKAEFINKKRKIKKEKGIFWIQKNRKLYEAKKEAILENIRNSTKDSYHYKMAEEGRNKYNNIDHIPYDKFLSELWVEEISPENISKVRIEFGQNRSDNNISKYNVFVPTDSVMSVSELPVLLNLIAKHNIDMDLKGEPDKKIYLDNIGVSENEAINMKYEKIEDRYGEGRDNKNSGCLVLKKINRNSNDQDLNYVPVKLKYLILKAEKQRLRKIEERLEETKDKSLEQINNELGNSLKSESKQAKMVERVRKRQFDRVSKYINNENMYDDEHQNKIRRRIIKHQNKVIDKIENKKLTCLEKLKAQQNSIFTKELG